MKKKDLVVNLDFKCNGNKGRVVKVEDDFFTILWVNTKQFYDYPYDEKLLESMSLLEERVMVNKKKKEV
ncbi:MAG: hypothetical protein WDA59_00445 [Methanofastidiosum sp.]